jgi:hypothetical protein
MVIKYASTPQLIYGEQPRPGANWRERFPEDAQPIASAPERGGACWIFEPSGDAYRSMFYRGQWTKLEPQRDEYTGAVRWQMTGERVANPVAWLPGDRKPPE